MSYGYERRHRFQDGIEYRIDLESVADSHSIDVLKRNDPYRSEHEEYKERELADYEKKLNKMNLSLKEKSERKKLFLMTL